MADGTTKVALADDAVVGVLQGALLMVARALRADLSWSERRALAVHVDRAIEVSIGRGIIASAKAPWEGP